MTSQSEPRWEEVFLTSTSDFVPQKGAHMQTSHPAEYQALPGAFVDNQGQTVFRDQYIAPMMTVSLVLPANEPIATGLTALVGTQPECGSEWIMPAYPNRISEVENANLATLKVGDLIKLPHAPDKDYLTILQIVNVRYLRNVGSVDFSLVWDKNAPNSSFQDSTKKELAKDQFIDSQEDDVQKDFQPMAFRAYRVNRKLPNLQLPPDEYFKDGSDYTKVTTTEHRGEALYVPQERTWPGMNFPGRYYDCFRQSRSSATPMKLGIDLDTSHSLVSAIQLVGYSLMDKQSVGIPYHHQLHDDEWYALRIREVNGKVLSNNEAAKHAFCIVNGANVHVDSETGLTRVHAYEPTGLVTEHFSPQNFPSITVEVVDRLGNPPRYGRMHLWLRLLCHRR